MSGTLFYSAQKIYRNNKRLFTQGPFGVLTGYCLGIRNSYRIRKQRSRNNVLLRNRFRCILNTIPLRCDPSADVEIHTTTSHSHLFMYMTAVKSLLRFYNNVAVVAHDDGSFSEQDKLLMREHIEGIKIIDKTTADTLVTQQLAGYPLCRKFRGRVVNAMELFDNILLAGKEKIVSMNSDVLFPEKPVEVIKWLTSDTNNVMSVYEKRPSHQKEFLDTFNCPVPPHVTLCLVAFFRSVFDPEFVEEVLAKTGFDWYTAQNIYPLLFDRKKEMPPIVFLDENLYQSSGAFPEDAVFRHYWTSTGYFNAIQFTDADSVISELSCVD